MTRSPDEIKKGLECCTLSYAKCVLKCPYVGDDCVERLAADALALIQQLEADLEDMTARYKIADDCAKKKGEMNEKLYAELTAVKAERDAAIADMTEMAKYGGENCCEWCDQTECECTCADVGIYAGFNWRGVQKEDSDA